MSRQLLRPGWIASHLAVVGIAVLFINLGLWQLDRHREVAAENARLADVVDRQPIPLAQALAAEDVRYLPARATGSYEPDAEVRLSPRSRNGVPGYAILTPLRLADGRALLVDRGWVPLDADPPAPPDGMVEVEGRLRTPAPARQVLPPDGDVVELVSNPDTDRLAAQVPGLITTAYLEVVDETARAAGTVPRPAEPVTFDGGDHLSYAAQWFAFTAIGLIGYPLLLRRRLADRRQDADADGDGDTATGRGAAAERHPVSQ